MFVLRKVEAFMEFYFWLKVRRRIILQKKEDFLFKICDGKLNIFFYFAFWKRMTKITIIVWKLFLKNNCIFGNCRRKLFFFFLIMFGGTFFFKRRKEEKTETVYKIIFFLGELIVMFEEIDI